METDQMQPRTGNEQGEFVQGGMVSLINELQ